MTHYSQNDEQEVILQFFEGSRLNRRFLDIGAFDGVTYSNTRALAELGWAGLMVEPDPFNLAKLIPSVAQFEGRVQVWSGAVAPSAEPRNLFIDQVEGRGWASSTVAANPGVLQPIRVNVIVHPITLTDILPYVGPISFLNIDAEWMDLLILESIRWTGIELTPCDMICIEPKDLTEREVMKRHFTDKLGWKIHHETPENIIAVRACCVPHLPE